MAEPIKIQLAIQGGGARIVAIMAVLEALEDLSKQIRVTRIVGTSAGAIAGAFFASGVGIKNIVETWKSGDLEGLIKGLSFPRSRFIPNSVNLPLKLFGAAPLWTSTAIHQYLEGVFAKCTPPITTFAELKAISDVDVTVISTNLRNKSSEESKPGDPIVSSLIDSAGLPYLLRKWGSGGSPVIVDGGIGDNLPAARLDLNKPDETPVCISFKPRVGANANPESFVTFSFALLDAAIDVASKKSAALVPHTHFISTPISTFDFQSAMAALKNGEYARIKAEATSWFQAQYDSIQALIEQKAIAYSVVALHPWQTENAVAQAVMSGVWSAIDAQFRDQCFHFKYVELRATLGCLATPPTTDTVRYVIEFEPGEDPLYCYWLGVADGGAGQLTAEPIMTIQEIESGEFVPHVRIPAVSTTEKTSARFMAIFFTPALHKGKKYRLVQTEIGNDLLTNLRKTKMDDLGFEPNRVLGAIEKARLVVDIPGNIKYLIHPKCGNVATKLVSFKLGDKDFPLDVGLLPSFVTHVVEGTDSKGAFALDISLGT